MRYYLLRPGPESIRCTAPLSEDDKEIGIDVEESRVRRAAVTVPYFDEELEAVSNGQLRDCLGVGFFYLLVSLRAKYIIQSVVLGDEIGFMPAKVLSRSGEELAEFHLIYSKVEQTVIDIEGSHVDFYQDSSIIAEVHRWSMQPTRLPRSDLFFCEARRWIATQNLRDAIESERLSGFEFVPIWSHSGGSL